MTAPRWIGPSASRPEEIHCGLCPHRCRLRPGTAGRCGARGLDAAGRPVSPWLGRFCSAAVDPIEKKPLNFWRPGTFIFSLGGLGCNMRCPFCQNHALAQPEARGSGPPPGAELPVERLLAEVRARGLNSVAYTYNEPILQAEYILEAAGPLQEESVATVLVTNGQIAPEPLAALAPSVAAANVDLKTFNPETYRQLGGSLETALAAISALVRAGVHVEVTTLVVPGVSDDPDEFAALVDWAASVSPDLPLHLSRYFPAHRFRRPPTDLDLLRRFQDQARTRLKRVLLGNVR